MKRRRSGSNGPPPEQYDLTAVAAPAPSPLELGERQPFECPFCGSEKANVKHKIDRDGEPRLFIGCFPPRRDDPPCVILKRFYLPALSEALGLGEGATREEIATALMKRIDPQGRLNLSEPRVKLVIDKYRRP